MSTPTNDPFTSASAQPVNDAEAEVVRDQYGRYLIPTLPDFPVTEVSKGGPYMKDYRGKPMGWTRATTFAKSISDTFALSQWSQRMVAKGLASRADLIAAASSTKIDDKKGLDSIVDQAKDAAASRAAANLGTAVHAFTEAVDKGEDPVVPDAQRADVDAYTALLEAQGIEVRPEWIERSVVVKRFTVGGTFDRIVMWRGRPTVLDLKTGRDLSYGWNEIAIQLALYANADAMWDWDLQRFLPMPQNLRTDVGLVVHLPVGKATATLYEVNLVDGWKAADLCESVREWRKVRNLASIVAADTLEANLSASLEETKAAPKKRSPRKKAAPKPVTLADRVNAATSKAELSALRKENLAEWTPELTALGLARLDKVLEQAG